MGLFRRPTPVDPAEVERLQVRARIAACALDGHDRTARTLDDRLASLDDRVTSVSTELANQLTELGHDIDALGRAGRDAGATVRSSWPTSRPATRSPSARIWRGWPTSCSGRADQPPSAGVVAGGVLAGGSSTTADATILEGLVDER